MDTRLRDAALARGYGHLTARQAASVAADRGVRRLVFDGEIVVAEDLARMPRRG